MIQIFIVATTPALRAGLRALAAGPEIAVVGEAAGVVLAPPGDLVLTTGDLAPLVAQALGAAPGMALVALADDPRLAALLRERPLRGWALLLPDAGPDELRAAIYAAAQGFVAVPQPWADRLDGPRAAHDPPGDPLTPRELEVLSLLSQGLPNKQIAGRLQISDHTVKFHIAAIFGKLGAASRTEAVSIGARRGLITL